MSYPNYPPQQEQYPQQGYPPQAQPPYPPAPPQQGYPQQGYPQQGYPQQAPPQGYPQQAPPQPQRHTTFADVYGQAPSGEGRSIAGFLHSQPGQTFYGTVSRALNAADTYLLDRPNTDNRERFGIRIPFFTPLAAFEGGRATWWCSGADLTSLNNQMAAAGVPLTDVSNAQDGSVVGRVPEEGAQISVTWTGTTPMPNLPGRPMNPRNDHRIVYQRPGTANGQPPVQQMSQQPYQGPADPLNQPGTPLQANVVPIPQQWQQQQQPIPPTPPVTTPPAGTAPMMPTGAMAAASPYPTANPPAMTAPGATGYPQPAPQMPQPPVQHPVTTAIQQATGAAEAARDASPPQQPVPPQMPQGAPVQALQPPQPLDPAAAQSLANTIRQPVYASDGTIARPPQ